MTFRSNRTLPISAFIVFGTFAVAMNRPTRPHAELLDMRFEQSGRMPGLIFEMKNTGDHTVRPLITWSMRDIENNQVAAGWRYEARELPPGETMNQFVPVGMLPPGGYQVIAEVDFQDNGPIQAMRKLIFVRAEYFPF